MTWDSASTSFPNCGDRSSILGATNGRGAISNRLRRGIHRTVTGAAMCGASTAASVSEQSSTTASAGRYFSTPERRPLPHRAQRACRKDNPSTPTRVAADAAVSTRARNCRRRRRSSRHDTPSARTTTPAPSRTLAIVGVHSWTAASAVCTGRRLSRHRHRRGGDAEADGSTPPIARRKTANPGQRARRLTVGADRLPPTGPAARAGLPVAALLAVMLGVDDRGVDGWGDLHEVWPFRSTDGELSRRSQDHGSVTFPCLEWLGCRAAQRREQDRQTSHPATAVKKTRAGHHGLSVSDRR